MRALLKGLGVVPLLFLYLFISGIIRLLPARQKTKRSAAIRTTSFFAKALLVLLGIRIHVKHRERLGAGGAGSLIVANHLSYLDVLIISSLAPSVFITSIELKNTVLLGALARISGCLFVERRKPHGLKQEIEMIAHVLGGSMPVALFPEGATSNGERVQPFKNSLFDAAVATRAEIVPLCLRYTSINNEDVTPLNRDAVFYHGGVTFFKHFPRVLALKSVDVEVLVLKIIKVHARHTRKDLAAKAHSAISAAYHE